MQRKAEEQLQKIARERSFACRALNLCLAISCVSRPVTVSPLTAV